jgi:hypothetical protein
MGKITIDVGTAGKDDRREGRLLTFPDQQERIIALPLNQWRMFDKMAQQWPDEWDRYFTEASWDVLVADLTLDDPGFEEALRRSISETISVAWALEFVGDASNLAAPQDS